VTAADIGRLIDMDNHYYEPDDCFTRHLPSGYSGPRIQVRRDESGQGRIYFGDQPSTYMQQTPTDRVARPGMFAADREDRVAISAQLGGDDLVQPRHILPYMNRDARVEWMDGHDIETSLVWPSLGLTVEPQLRTDPKACVANLKAFNRWLEQDWGFAYQNRIMGVPFLTLVDLDAAVEELDYVLAHGAKVVHLLCTPVSDRSLADPYFEPFWARTSEAGVAVAFHAANPGYSNLLSIHWGEDPYPTPEGISAFQRFAFWVERAITDTVASLIFHNLFGRFPDQQILVVELGSDWVPYTLAAMDRAAKSGRTGRWLGGPIQDRPSDLFRRHFRIAPFFDEEIAVLAEAIGWDRIVLGSDFPHPEGLPNPWSFFQSTPFDVEQARLVGRDNALGLLTQAPSHATIK
jgi:predicted TIM-barrel fold metal-dependent hydrolase